MLAQASLFGGGSPQLDPRFRTLRHHGLRHRCWVEHQSSWLQGHESVFATLLSQTRWRSSRRFMYDREVDVPRGTASLPTDGPIPPVLERARLLLELRYDRRFPSLTANLYRTGDDSVAWHSDRMGALRPDTVICILSLGNPRRFLLKPERGGASMGWALGWGDLLVMGGGCQQHYLHAVPKAKAAGPRISVMFRERVPGADDPMPTESQGGP